MENQTDIIEYLLDKMLIKFEESFPLLPNYLIIVKVQEIKAIIEEIYKSLPPELKEAQDILNTTKQIQAEAQKNAEQIIQDAKNEAARILSESDDIKQIQKQAEKIKEQTIEESQEIKRKAIEDVRNYKNQVQDEAVNTTKKVESFAEQILKSLDFNLTQYQQLVKNGQEYLKKTNNVLDKSYNLLE